MEKKEYKNMFEQEDTHFFYVSLHKLILSFIKKFICIDSRLRGNDTIEILDAGCGTGRLAELMKKYGNVTGIDMSNDALKLAKKRGIETQKASVTKLPFKNNSFDIVTSIDVITSKHVKNDMDALKEFARVLKPNGMLLLRVSAIAWLILPHDTYVHSNKRYSKQMLKQKLEKCGFQIEKISYIQFLLFFPALISHFYYQIFPNPKVHSSIQKSNKIVNRIGNLALSCERFVIPFFPLPFGLGLIAICRKK